MPNTSAPKAEDQSSSPDPGNNFALEYLSSLQPPKNIEFNKKVNKEAETLSQKLVRIE